MMGVMDWGAEEGVTGLADSSGWLWRVSATDTEDDQQAATVPMGKDWRRMRHVGE